MSTCPKSFFNDVKMDEQQIDSDPPPYQTSELHRTEVAETDDMLTHRRISTRYDEGLSNLLPGSAMIEIASSETLRRRKTNQEVVRIGIAAIFAVMLMAILWYFSHHHG